MASIPNAESKSQPAGWELPSTIQPTYSSQPNYPLQPGYPSQPNYPLQSGYPSQPNYPLQSGYPSQPIYPIQPGYPVGFSGQTQTSSFPPPYSIPIDRSENVPIYEPGNPSQSFIHPDVESQKPEVLPDNFGSSFSSQVIRHKFVRKVYSILTFQLLVTLSFVAVFTFHEGVQAFVQHHGWICYLSYAVYLVTYFTLICCSGARRKWPGNMILLSIFTLSLSYLLGTIASFHKTELVLFSVGITAVICFLITMFAIQTKIDFTGWSIYLYVALWVLVIFGLVAIFVRSPTMNLLYSGGIVLLFSMYLIFDTQRIIGGRKHELSAEEHITGALVLYIDVVIIFLHILGLSRSN